VCHFVLSIQFVLAINLHKLYYYLLYSWVGGAVEHGDTDGSDKVPNTVE